MKLTLKNIGKIGQLQLKSMALQSLLVKTTRAKARLAALFLQCLTVFAMFKSKLKTSESIV